MSQIEVEAIVSRHIAAFADRRRKKIAELKPRELLSRKNPYLFIARQIETPDELAEAVVSAALSSSEETVFGGTLEDIAIDICAAAFGGYKSVAEGVDLEFTRGGRRYLVSIKSGPNWGNRDQVSRMRENFRRAIGIARQRDAQADVLAVNGCCYGLQSPSDRGDYIKLCGAEFWELISGEPEMYQRLIHPIRQAASNGFTSERHALTDRVRDELVSKWSDGDGNLDWAAIVAGSAQTGASR